MPIVPTFEYETQLRDAGASIVAGVDEAGMGAWAGPVVAAAVIFPNGVPLNSSLAIRDSKTLSANQRAKARVWLQAHTIWATGRAEPAEIDALGIRHASHVAMQRAIDGLDQAPQALLIDGNPAQPHPRIWAQAIVKGDSLSVSIAAASILAKEARDEMMRQAEKRYPGYGFADHKGYGTQTHREALGRHGVSDVHRRSYAPIISLLNTVPPSTL